jgi:hypothetical protein
MRGIIDCGLDSGPMLDNEDVELPKGITLKDNVEIRVQVMAVGETTFSLALGLTAGNSEGEDPKFEICALELEIERKVVFDDRTIEPIGFMDAMQGEVESSQFLNFVVACVAAEEGKLKVENAGEELILNFSLRAYTEDYKMSRDDAVKYFNLPKYMQP